MQVCLALGFDLPYFCWHPAMHSVGACRQCAVKLFRDEQDKRGRIVMSCMTPAAEGTRISVDDPEARAFRAGVIEMLMLNHPHDCPVCDEGGECHLQDMTVLTGHNYRHTRFPKRTHRNQDIGPFVTHEMNRCIQCYRCVRFYRDHAGGRDLDVLGWHDHVYFGRQNNGRLESEFSGNLVEVCPTGVFTDKSLYSHYTRKWDLQVAPSVCAALRPGLQHDPRRAVRRPAANPLALQRAGERVLPVRSRPVWVRVRERPRARAKRGETGIESGTEFDFVCEIGVCPRFRPCKPGTDADLADEIGLSPHFAGR